MRLVTWIFGLTYVVALGLFAISAWGLFGQDRDPLGGVFLLPLGLPWNLVADRLTGASTAALVAAPAVNLALLIWLTAFLRRRRMAGVPS